MPRRRTIACNHCGYLQLKRATECEGCGRMTRRERVRWIARAIQIGTLLIVAAFVYSRISGLALQ